MNLIIAAYCYLGKGNSQKIIIVTSSSGRWILPKGQPEKRIAKKGIALDEAWEEAGVTGSISGEAIDFVIKRGRKNIWRIYPVLIDELADDWPERTLRKRRLVSAEVAIEEIDNRGLREAVKVLAKKHRKG
jgi:8-oxo-dGTP pyrophosphatase MutT (NUDIX family)